MIARIISIKVYKDFYQQAEQKLYTLYLIHDILHHHHLARHTSSAHLLRAFEKVSIRDRGTKGAAVTEVPETCLFQG